MEQRPRKEVVSGEGKGGERHLRVEKTKLHAVNSTKMEGLASSSREQRGNRKKSG